MAAAGDGGGARGGASPLDQLAADRLVVLELVANRRRGIRRSGIRLLGHDEGVIWVPGQLPLAADAERVGLGAVEVLREHGQLLTAGRADHVLDRYAEERR